VIVHRKAVAQLAWFGLLVAGSATLVRDSGAGWAPVAASGERSESESVREQLRRVEAATAEERELGKRFVLERNRDAAKLQAASECLKKAYADIAGMEKQMIDVSRLKNDLEQQQAYLQERSHGMGDLAIEPKIDGKVQRISERTGLIRISVGRKDLVQVGYRFTVYRGSSYVSKVVVEKVGESWSECRELTDFRKDVIEKGDSVSTRVFD
jgi:hypothetical protein